MEKNCLIHFGNQNDNTQFLQEASWVWFTWSFLSMDVDSCSVILRSSFKKKDNDQYKLKDLYDSERIKNKTNKHNLRVFKWDSSVKMHPCLSMNISCQENTYDQLISVYLQYFETFIVRHYMKYLIFLRDSGRWQLSFIFILQM